MNRVLWVSILLLVTSGFVLSEQPPTIGSKFNKKWKAEKEPSLCMTESSQLDPCVDLAFDGINHRVAYSQLTHKVAYVYTNDEKFRTTSGLKVGDPIPVSRKTVRALAGWQVYAPTTSDGWRPIVAGETPRIKLKDGTVMDLTAKDGPDKNGTAEILGFSKGRE
jgi:hypothetical protein